MLRKMSILKNSEAESQNSSQVDASALAIVTVTYLPDIEILRRQFESLPDSALKIVIDNATPADMRGMLQAFYASNSHCLFVGNDTNVGLSAAINQGVLQALKVLPGCRYLLFLDQDTEPGAGAVLDLLRWYERVNASDGKVGCVGPRLIDVETGLDHGFHRIARWRWVRRHPEPHEAPVQCSNMNCSGTLVGAELFRRLGGLDEAFFVDHLDTEWAFRVLAAGYRLYGIPAVAFHHRMGQKTWRFWLGGWRIWPYRAPYRHYLLFRNSVWLMRRDYVPAVWKFWAVMKLLVTMCVHALMDSRRISQLGCMLKGIAAGFHGGATVDESFNRFL